MALRSFMALRSPDLELIEAARSIIRERFKPNFHHVGAALRTQRDQIFAAVHLEANVGRIAVCAEAIALGMAAATADTNVESIVAVDRNGNVVSPCGMCRELISDYSPDARVIVPGKGSAEVLSIRDLLPQKYVRNET